MVQLTYKMICHLNKVKKLRFKKESENQWNLWLNAKLDTVFPTVFRWMSSTTVGNFESILHIVLKARFFTTFKR